MRFLYNHCSLMATIGSSNPPSLKPQQKNQKPKSNLICFSYYTNKTTKWHQKLFLHALTGTFSFNLLISSPPSIAELLVSSPPSTEICREEQLQEEQKLETAPELVSNEEIVEEAWEIVNDSFLDSSDRHRFSPDQWMQKKENITGRSIRTRSQAHDIIRKMLASLDDPYTRFLSPPEFAKMARYDMTGIGINLREIPDDNGNIKLEVLGLILDSPAHDAGVRQGDEVISVNGVDVRGKSAVEVSSLLQGPNETFVTMEVKHGNCGPVQSMEVQRRLVARTPVFYRLEQKGTAPSVGYIRIKEFNALATKDLITAMKRLQDSGASYFVLDLRDNLGGLVQAGIEVAKLFLNQGDPVCNPDSSNFSDVPLDKFLILNMISRLSNIDSCCSSHTYWSLRVLDYELSMPMEEYVYRHPRTVRLMRSPIL